MAKSTSCIIVEDDRHEAEALEKIISRYSFLQLKHVFHNGAEALDYLRTANTQLVFMDIDLPGLNGVDIYKIIKPGPVCIFVTAHSEYAWQSVETQPFAFIQKPVEEDKFAITMKRLQAYMITRSDTSIEKPAIEQGIITVRSKHIIRKIKFDDILYLESDLDYTEIHLAPSKDESAAEFLTTQSTLTDLLEALPPKDFRRVHRSYAIAVKKITGRSKSHFLLANHEIPIGRTYRTRVQDLI